MEGKQGRVGQAAHAYAACPSVEAFGIAPRGTIRIGTKTAKGYHWDQFEEAWKRYGGNDPSHRHKSDEMGTCGTFRTVTPERDVTDQKCEKPAWNGHCDGVTVQKGESGQSEQWPLVCDHCGDPESPGQPVRECYVKGERILLHADCQDEWQVAPDPDGWAFNMERP